MVVLVVVVVVVVVVVAQLQVIILASNKHGLQQDQGLFITACTSG